MHSIIKQTGSAVVVALFVVAMVVIAATAMLVRIQQDMRRAELIIHANQATLYTQGAVAWGIDTLTSNWNPAIDHVLDKTPLSFPEKKLDNATIQATIYDAQGFFNLNNLSDTNYHDDFIRLIKIVAPKISLAQAQALSAAVADWVAGGASQNVFHEYYSKQATAYRAPHRLMVSVSELRLVKGMSAEMYMALLPYIIALPVVTPININNAEEPVLMSLSPTLTREGAKGLVMLRQQTPFDSVQRFLNADVVKNNPFPENKITTISQFFLLKTQVTIGEQKTIIYTLLQRDVKNSQPNVTVLWQSKGTL